MNTAKIKLLSAMGIFGTIGIFVRFIPLSSAAIAFTRGALGVLFLLGAMAIGRKKLDLKTIKENLSLLCCSGIAIGFNWILLFESYKHTTVATATICYYLAPFFLLMLSPLLGEKLTFKKISCIVVALVGMVFVSGVLDGPPPAISEWKGIFMGIGAAILYASVMFMNKKLPPMAANDKTLLQLGSSAVVLLPYLLLTEGASVPTLKTYQWLLLLCVGILHTGFAYGIYFDAIKKLPAKTVAIFSYLDPVLAIILSSVILREQLTAFGVIGSALILASALYSELPSKADKTSDAP